MNKHTLFLDTPAPEWEMATPIGNGSMGAMIYGRTDREIIQLTEERIWSGSPKDTTYPSFRDKIDEIRRLFLVGQPVEANEYAKIELAPAITRIKSQETAGDLILDFKNEKTISDCRRELDMMCGIAKISYTCGEEHILREFLSG